MNIKKMKKIIVLLAVILSFSGVAKASHILGGEISWKCLQTGKYIFYMSVYRDCSGIPLTYGNEVINISGSPLPTNGVNSITVKPDLNRFNNSGNGDTSPKCTPQYGNPVTCAGGDNGTVQAFYYVSDPVTLAGVPPANGWRFTHTPQCCRPNDIENIVSSGTILLRAIMYSGPNGQPANPCFDSSPQFRALPTTLICRGYEFTYNHTAIDEDLDSLVYSWDRTYNPPANNPIALNFKPGYSQNSPTPGIGANINNIAATIDPLTGITSLAVYSGSGVKKFLTVARVDAYKSSCGGAAPKRVATIFREIPISLFNCEKLPNGNVNNVPEVKIDGIPTRSLITDIVAGQPISLPVSVEDNDLTGIGIQLQVLTMVPDGLLFSKSKTLPDRSSPGINPCPVPTAEPCAYLRNSTPFLDASLSPAAPVLKGLGSINTEFVWQTDCKHIQTCTGSPGTNQGIYNFVMRVYDDHCAIPALNYPTITIRVKDPIPMTEPVMKGASVNLDGSITLNWYSAIDSTNQHVKHEAQGAKPSNGANPGSFWQMLDTNITDYVQEKKTDEFYAFDRINPLNTNSPFDIFSPDGEKNGSFKDFYTRMRSVSGCTEDVRSNWSSAVRIIELESTPIGVNPQPVNSRARLTWNRARPLSFAPYYPYVFYESQPHFYIYANDSLSRPNGASNPNNWYIVGETSGTTFEVDATTCNDYVGFRVEMRDTVIVWSQGSDLNSDKDSIKTLTFSTFSFIDSMFMKPLSFIPAPKFDTVEVRDDGTVFLRINLQGKRTTGTYNIYEGSIAPGNLLASVNALTDSVVVLSGALLDPKDIILEAINSCDPANITSSSVYNSFLVKGRPGSSCSGEYKLNWTPPNGFPNGVSSYSVFVDSTGNGYQLVSTHAGVNDTTATVTGIKKNTTYRFRVIAYSPDGEVNISAPKVYTTPLNLRNNTTLPAPTPRCTYVTNDGDVILSWLPAQDTSSNFFAYNIQFRQLGTTTWMDIPNNADDALVLSDSSFRVSLPGAGAQNAQYEFRIATMAGCLGDEDGGYNTINSIFVSAIPRTNDPFKRVDVSWNPTGVDYGVAKYLQVYRGENSDGYMSPFYTTAINTTAIVDAEDKSILGCTPTVDYFVDHIDSIFQPRYTCEVRSNVVTATIPTVKPGNQKLTHIDFDPMSKRLVAYWSADNAGNVIFMNIITTDGMNSGLINYVDVVPQQDFQPMGQMPPLFSSIPIPNTVFDATDSAVVIAGQAEDNCGNAIDEDSLYFHKSMDIDVEWNLCDSTNKLTWTPYVGFSTNHSIGYTILKGTSYTNVNDSIGFVVDDTTFNHLVTSSGTYFYRVRARSLDDNLMRNPPYIFSNSNIDSVSSIFGLVPFYSNLTYATVLPTNNVEVQFYRDTLTELKSYTIYRGEAKDKLLPIDFVLKSEVEEVDRFEYADLTVDPDARSYYYQVVTQNECDNVIDISNLGRTIHLTVESDDEGLRNTLRWNRYEGWDSTTAFYNVYRGLEGVYSTEVYAVVAPNSRYDYTTFVDDISSEVTSRGKFCYRVEAVQGPFNDRAVNNYPNDLEPETSNSNVVCVVQEPLMYVPNAFAPDGLNKRFGPKGQFFNYSQFEMSIFNRWGELVYITRDINKGWDGTVDGDDAGIGSYVYVIRYVDGDGEEHRKKGTVTLIR